MHIPWNNQFEFDFESLDDEILIKLINKQETFSDVIAFNNSKIICFKGQNELKLKLLASNLKFAGELSIKEIVLEGDVS